MGTADGQDGDRVHASAGTRQNAEQAIKDGILKDGDSCSFKDDDGSFCVADVKGTRLVVAARSK